MKLIWKRHREGYTACVKVLGQLVEVGSIIQYSKGAGEDVAGKWIVSAGRRLLSKGRNGQYTEKEGFYKKKSQAMKAVKAYLMKHPVSVKITV